MKYVQGLKNVKVGWEEVETEEECLCHPLLLCPLIYQYYFIMVTDISVQQNVPMVSFIKQSTEGTDIADVFLGSHWVGATMQCQQATCQQPICILTIKVFLTLFALFKEGWTLNYSHKIKDIKEVSRSNNSAKMARAVRLTWMYLMAYKVNGLIRCILVSPGIEKNK